MRGIIAVLLVGAVAGGVSPSRRDVVLVVEHSSFSEHKLTVRAGQTVRFVVRNQDPIAHELIVGDNEVQAVHEQGTEKHHGAKPGEISVPAGTERSTTYTFERAGSLYFACHLPGHYAYGMRGTIDVLP